MSRLIDADALLDGLDKLYRRRELNAAYNGYRGSFVTWNDAIYAIKDAPSAQPEPSQIARDIATIIENEQDMRVILAQPQRMRGRWMPDNLVGGGYWVCTACKHPTEAFAANVIYKFCPNCGADMRGGQDG